ncbi:cation diffusion facilitator family transporter [Catellatospora citrea]|uniref:Cation efflux system protein n=1 Tax=Catellatospora citrea TaxID=53366 RepID=A0A8J3NXG2_9ACTN|nr:cation diffusion facilitator family transporter [Catellatospora citrea]RKE12471.1 cation diffusion facilitator family transporter [Catellatospora citrea]GIF96297.1 cation efflux system protein [Catellatospora citrea]
MSDDHRHGRRGHTEHHHPHDHSTHGADAHDDRPDHDHADVRRDAGHGHDGHGHDGHGHADAGLLSRLRHQVGHLVSPHSHDTADKVDSALESSREGLRALWISLVVLGITAVMQAVVVYFSHSVALLGDTLHNVADALTAVPLGVAFLLGRRRPTRSYTYGFGRAEDLAGIFIVLTIAASAALAGYEAVRRLLDPQQVRHLPYVAAAALIGFAGNELVARYRIVVGRRIGSAALVADGLHARTDGFTSLAVLLGAGGAALGWWWADPVVGLLITVAILLVLKDAAREVYRRLMDAVDPKLVDAVEQTLRGTPGVRDVGEVRLRWIGHRLRAECAVAVDAELTVARAHAIAVDAEHRLLHAVPKLTAAMVHADPAGAPADPHAVLNHHRDPEVGGARDRV